MLPDIKRSEWKSLVKGETKHNFYNYVLQLKITDLSKKVTANKIDEEIAVHELYELCAKYEKAVQRDLNVIFNLTN